VRGAEYRLEHRVHLLQYSVVPEAQYLEALAPEETRTIPVHLIAVLRTVQFHNQPAGFTVEIDYVRRDGMLPTELQAIQTTGAQAVPQGLLGIRT
jgi:hypothetical protein